MHPSLLRCAAHTPYQIVETEHLTKALLEQSDSLVKRILEKAGADAGDALRATTRFIERQPRVSGTATQVLGRNLEALVDAARRARDEAGDECVTDTRCCTCACMHHASQAHRKRASLSHRLFCRVFF
jgi:ATP-dependent Clp protease ATP-binding subunit ClpB